MNKKYLSMRNKIVSVAIGLLIWQLAADYLHLSILLVGPWQVFLRLFTIWQVQGFFSAILYTMEHICGGFLLGYLLGIIFASAAYRSKTIETLLWPWMAVIKSVPVASFVVICLIWLSASNLSVFISFLIVIPIAYQNTLTAFRGIDSNLIDLCRMEQISYPRMLLEILLPIIREQLASTASVTAGMAWKAGVAAEIIGTPSGSIGKQLYLAKTYLDTDDLLAWTVIIVVISVICEKAFVWGVDHLGTGN